MDLRFKAIGVVNHGIVDHDAFKRRVVVLYRQSGKEVQVSHDRLRDALVPTDALDQRRSSPTQFLEDVITHDPTFSSVPSQINSSTGKCSLQKAQNVAP